MNSRERVFAALAHAQPDRCPVDLMLEPTTARTLVKHFGAANEQELNDILSSDMQFVGPDSFYPWPGLDEEGAWTERTGVRYRMVQNEFCSYAECIHYPLAFVEDVDDFRHYDKWPTAADYDWAHFSEKIGNIHEKRVTKIHTGGLYEMAWGMRGQEQFLMDMALNPEIAHYILNKLCDYWSDYIRCALESAGDKIDIIYTYDDIATQSSLVMSPQMLEEFVFPYHRKLSALIKSYGKKVMYHSCGAIFSVIDQLKNLPIDILTPIQPLAANMDFAAMKARWGDSLCFHGGTDIQDLLPHGTPEQIQETVKRNIAIMGKGGGYILGPAHAIQNDTPVENIIAMYDVSIR